MKPFFINSNKWLWIPTVLIFISLLAPLFFLIMLHGFSDSLKFYIRCYLALIIFLVCVMWFYAKKTVLLIIGCIFLFFGISFLFRFFTNTLFFAFFSDNIIRSSIYIPLLLGGLFLLFISKFKNNKRN